jgi:hypothetical protein
MQSLFISARSSISRTTKKRSQKTPLPNSEFTTLNYTAANKLAASALSVSKGDPNPVAQSDHRPPHLGRTVHPDRPLVKRIDVVKSHDCAEVAGITSNDRQLVSHGRGGDHRIRQFNSVQFPNSYRFLGDRSA